MTRAAVIGPAATDSRRKRLSIAVREVPTPRPHAPGWAVVRPALSGICDTDLTLLDGVDDSTLLSAYRGQERWTPGHEVVGVVESAWPSAAVAEGQRVIVEPTLRCRHKGLPECGRCRSDDGHRCENADRPGPLCSGHMIGFSERTGGGWSDGFLVHEDMLIPADDLPDHRGVLAEPVAASLHAALRWRGRGDRVVVLGSGASSRLIVAALARLHPDVEISVAYDQEPRRGSWWPQRSRTVIDPAAGVATLRAMGAAHVWSATSLQLIEEVATRVDGRILRARSGGLPVIDGGVDAVFDCRGTQESVDVGLRLLRSGGSLIVASLPRRQEVDWSLVWWRELTVRGSSHYGREDDGRRTFSIAREWLADPHYPIDGLVTHRYSLEGISDALDTARGGSAAGAIKVVIEGPAAQLPTRHAAGAQSAPDPDSFGPLVRAPALGKPRAAAPPLRSGTG